MTTPGDLLQRLAASAPPEQEKKPVRWIPIRSLAERHRPRIRTHLLALPDADRYLRFGYNATDSQISTYVDRINFERDEVFGIFNRRLQVIAMAHLAYLAEGPGGARSAEFGVSVLPHARGRGYGSRLFDHAVLHASNRGVGTLMIQALSENVAMLKIARAAGATVEREGSESEAFLKLPHDDLMSRIGEAVEDGAAELDYHLKVQARRVDGLLDVISELKRRLGLSDRHIASE
jgi:RimJ/RimL family protein N-acetyltransferase